MKLLTDQECVEKQSATFICTLSKPRLKVAWYKNGKPVKESERIQVSQEGKIYKLVIDNAQLDDAGEYMIKFGEEGVSKAFLTVKGQPDNFNFS
jgi:hypothetical protein